MLLARLLHEMLAPELVAPEIVVSSPQVIHLPIYVIITSKIKKICLTAYGKLSYFFPRDSTIITSRKRKPSAFEKVITSL